MDRTPRTQKNAVLREFAKKIKLRRYELELTQEELAERANLHVNYVGGIERGERNPTYEKILDLAKALEISPRDLMP